MKIGDSFIDEIKRAGLAGLPFSWTTEGELTYSDAITAGQKTAIEALLAAHDPKKPSTLKQIAELESQVTPSRLLDAFTGSDGGWLHNLQSQITALKQTL